MKYSIDIETPLSIDDFVLFDYNPDPSHHTPIGAVYIGKIANIDYIQIEDERDEDSNIQNFTDTKIRLRYLVRAFCIEDIDNYEKYHGCKPAKTVLTTIGYENLITKINPDVVSILYNQIYNTVKDETRED